LESDLFRRYLDALPPDDRLAAERAFESDPLFQQAIREAEEMSDEQMKVLSAEWDEYSETGEVPPGSILDGLMERARETSRAAALTRIEESGGRSPVARYLGRTRGHRMSPELEAMFASVAPLDQTFLYRLFDFYGELTLLTEEGAGAALDRMRREGRHLIPVEEVTHKSAFAAMVSFTEFADRVLTATDEEAPHETVQLRAELVDHARDLREFHRRWGAWYEGKIATWTAEMLAAKLGLDAEQQARLRLAVSAWQKLVWTAECLHHGGIYFGGRPEPFPRDEGEAAMLLVALGDLLEPLLHSPELLRVLPKRADAYLYRRHATKALLDSISIRREPELAGVFATDIRERRHYTLDHIARVELGGRYGVERVTLAPEQRGVGDAFFAGFVVEHKRGAIVGAIFLTEPGEEWPAATYVDGFQQALEATPLSYEELTAPLTMLVLAAWRNLVVPRVREEHYEITVRRKPKASGNRPARQVRRGDVAVVDYLPRTLVYRRMEEAARRERGDDAPLRAVYRVGNFARRLPEGEHRSPDADTYAAEIGMPLAAWQTVVKAHWRGGTPEERAAAELAADVPLREWRSWDALDLLAA
jgi:hypothetical protein